MKILIMSDNHGKCDNLELMLEREKPIGALIHCGDVEGTEDYIQALAECPVYMVSGNNDFFSDLPREREEVIGGYQFLICHGHYYGVSMELSDIEEEGRSRGAELIAFGHTHKPVIKTTEDGITLLNPGSISYPRQEGRRPTYIVMETTQKDYHLTIKEL